MPCFRIKNYSIFNPRYIYFSRFLFLISFGLVISNDKRCRYVFKKTLTVLTYRNVRFKASPHTHNPMSWTPKKQPRDHNSHHSFRLAGDLWNHDAYLSSLYIRPTGPLTLQPNIYLTTSDKCLRLWLGTNQNLGNKWKQWRQVSVPACPVIIAIASAQCPVTSNSPFNKGRPFHWTIASDLFLLHNAWPLGHCTNMKIAAGSIGTSNLDAVQIDDY